MKARILSAVVAATALLGVSTAYANAVVNGGFETGDTTGWTLTGNTGFSAVDGVAPHSGNFGFYSGELAGSSLSQVLVTAQGENYTLSFWLQNEADLAGDVTPNEFSVSIGGVTLLTLTNEGAFGYREYTFNFVGAGPATELAFSFTHEPAFWDLDDVSIDRATSVPEPGTLALLALAGALPLVRRRRG